MEVNSLIQLMLNAIRLRRPDSPSYFAKLKPGSSGPSPTMRKVMWLASFQLTRPTRAGPLSWASVRMPSPKVDVPVNCCFWPFSVTCQVNAPPGWTVRAIAVSAAGWAFQVPAIDAPCGGVVSVGAGEATAVAGSSLDGSSCRSSFAESVSLGFSATTCLRIVDRGVGVALGQVVVGKHEPGGGRVRVGRAVALQGAKLGRVDVDTSG